MTAEWQTSRGVRLAPASGFSEVRLLTPSRISWSKFRTGPGSHLTYDHKTVGLFLGGLIGFDFLNLHSFIRKAERHSSFHVPLYVPGAYQCQKFHLGLPHGWQGCKYFEPSPVISKAACEQKTGSETKEPGLKPDSTI